MQTGVTMNSHTLDLDHKLVWAIYAISQDEPFQPVHATHISAANIAGSTK